MSVRIRLLGWVVTGGALLVTQVAVPAAASGSSTGTGGELLGEWTPPDRLKPTPVVLRYFREEAGRSRVRLRLGADGERFVGESLRIDGRQSPVRVRTLFRSWTATVYDDLETGPLGRPWRRSEVTIEGFRERTRNDVIGTLIGDRGRQMRCRFELEDPPSGLAGGARGACQTSDGETVRFPGAGEP